MTSEISLRLGKAKAFLSQAADIDPEAKPETLLHQCYYAMFHAAVSVLLAQGGVVPFKHSSVVGQFARLVKDRGPSGRQAGKALNSALDLRLVGDYQIAPVSLVEDARRIKREATDFVCFCERLLEAE